MSVAHATKTVTTTAGRLDSADQSAGASVAVKNVGSVTVYVGGPGVTTAAGYPVAAGEAVSMDVGKGDEVYGIVGSGTCEVRVLESGI